jgi:hypothetical protein
LVSGSGGRGRRGSRAASAKSADLGRRCLDTLVTDILRKRIGEAFIERVAGPQRRAPGERRQTAEADRWFAADRPIRQVHNDCAMFVGGITALLLQSLHPLAMAAVADHSGYRTDP